jgi:hypothetical protein
LRDDVQQILIALTDKLKNKISLLQNIHNREIDKRHLIRSESIDQLLSALKEDDYLFQEIDLLDYEISSLKGKLCEIAGISSSQLHQYLIRTDSLPCREYAETIHRLQNLMKEVVQDREKSISFMKSKYRELQTDITTLNTLLRLKIPESDFEDST